VFGPGLGRFARAGFLFSRYGLCLVRASEQRIPRKNKRREKSRAGWRGLIAAQGVKSRKTGAKMGQKRRIWPQNGGGASG